MKQLFGEFVRERRKAQGIKLKDFAGMIGISAVYASYIETGKRPAPPSDKLESISSVLRLVPAEREQLCRLARQSRREHCLTDELNNYLIDSPYIIDAIAASYASGTPENIWRDFTDKISGSSQD